MNKEAKSPIIRLEDEIGICINLINLIDNVSLSNEEVLAIIAQNGYVPKANLLDDQRLDKEEKMLYLLPILKRIIDVLMNADPSLDLVNQRYACDYLTIKARLLKSCDTLHIDPKTLISYIQKAKDTILQCHMVEYTIPKLLKEANVELAQEIIGYIENQNYHYGSYRLIADYYGKKADEKGFFAMLKKCDLRKEVWDIVFIKSNFLEAYSAKYSLEKGLEMAKRKEFGKSFLPAVLSPYLAKKSFKEIEHLMEQEADFDAPKLYLKEQIFTQSFNANQKNQTMENFYFLMTKLIEIPSKIRLENSDFSLRDNLWSSIGEGLIDHNYEHFKKEIAICIQKISHRVLKNSLKSALKKVMPKIQNGIVTIRL